MAQMAADYLAMLAYGTEAFSADEQRTITEGLFLASVLADTPHSRITRRFLMPPTFTFNAQAMLEQALAYEHTVHHKASQIQGLNARDRDTMDRARNLYSMLARSLTIMPTTPDATITLSFEDCVLLTSARAVVLRLTT